MEYVIELLVRLKTLDTTALTAKDTLQRDMGYGSILGSISREDYWAVTVEEADEAGAGRLAKEFAGGTKIFVNPNKHVYRAAVRKEGDPPAAGFLPGGKPSGGIHQVCVLVQYREDEKAMLVRETLRKTLGYGEKVREVARGTLWTMGIREGSRDEALARAEEIALTRGIGQGLLVNPHSQMYEIL